MIVSEFNLIAYLYIPGKFTPLAERVAMRDPDWMAPQVWKNEFVNILATTLRKNEISMGAALAALSQAEKRVIRYTELDPIAVLKSSVETKIATYDCEYVDLARKRGLKVVTGDKEMQKKFKDVVVSLEAFAEGI